ncbi:MAG: hypothetical protein KJ906_01350 [Nanoarchaeota archaeon]|nr:hypothetical protein [Nanoarchaeota archaeon]
MKDFMYFGNYNLDNLEERGYIPIGKPGLITGEILLVEEHEDLMRTAIKQSNGDDFECDGVSIYVRHDTRDNINDRANHVKIAFIEHYKDIQKIPILTIVQPLKKI